MRKPIVVLAVSALLASVATIAVLPSAGALANGQTITFGEDPDAGLEQYTAIGVTFDSNPCCIGNGLSNGDDGNWGLDGTNDPYFLGFNEPYSGEVTLDEQVATLSLDAARSNGSDDGTITLESLLGAVVVDTDTVVLGAVNAWSTLTVTGPMDGFRITGDGTDFHPFGVDNIVIGPVPTTPVADAGPDQSVQLGEDGVEVTLDGTGSTDPNDDPLTYTWTGDFDGATTDGATPTVVFTEPGSHTITLEVDDGDETDTDTVTIVVAAADEPPPPPPAAEPADAAPDFTG